MNYLGFDIGGTKCAVLLGDETGTILFREEIASGSPDAVLPRLFEIARRYPRADFAGISCGGPLDEGRGLILSPPNLPGWNEIPMVKMVEDAFGIPARIINDADAGALAEWRFGAGRGARNMAFLTFGTGLGAGLILDGRRYGGASGMAGELGHVRLAPLGPVGYGKAGSVEGFASGSGIAQMGRCAALEALQKGEPSGYCRSYEELSGVTAKSVALAADEGDAVALAVYREAGARLGAGLSILVDLLNLELIVIGGIYMRSAHLLREAMEETMRRECLPASLSAVRVVPAALGEQIGDLAAVSVAMEREREEKARV